MNLLVIGHRGVGKTTFIEAYAKLHPEFKAADLDREVERATGRSIAELLASGVFRAREREVLNELLSAPGPHLIALGAGFEGDLPPGTRVLWLRRVTDATGRSFINRPRLDRGGSPFAEYQSRFAAREARYRCLATEELTLPEGEYASLLPKLEQPIPYDLTILPEHVRHWSYGRVRGFRRLELRDDVLETETIVRLRRDIPDHQILFSRRREHGVLYAGLLHDWDLELGAPPPGVRIVSRHAAPPPEARDRRIKFAPDVESFAELMRWHRWWLADPEQRAFLPRSRDGRWQWYRALFGPRMWLHFVREGDGSSLDQPWMWQAVSLPPLTEGFAAVLGAPVAHSRSPRAHQTFFKQIPFVAIEVRADEFAEAMPILRELGLRFVAVTAPLKALAGALVDAGPLNTLAWDKRKWVGTNTDLNGLRELFVPNERAWIWGRGALLGALKSVWPDAQDFSARAGEGAATEAPDLLIWATGRSRPFQFPKVIPKRILDLNYGDDSPGLEFAVKHGVPYQSGLELFKLQAFHQREFWKAYL